MRKLRLVGLSAGGGEVIFVDDAGTEFAASADDRLRAALRGDRARLGQLEIEMESVLRPRDIQARIRAGDSPEVVAGFAQVPVEKIMAYCFPVLAERQHIAENARRSHVRRKGVDGPARPLDAVVSDRLRARTLDPDAAEWDAWRRDDGRWSVQVSYHSGERQRMAVFAFDAVGRYSTAEDDEAKWLTGERQSTSKGPQPREPGRGGDRRLSAVPDSDDLLSLSPEASRDQPAPNDYASEPSPDDELTDDLTAVVRAIQEPAPDDLEAPVEGEFEAGGVVDSEPQHELDDETETETEPRPEPADSADSPDAAASEPPPVEVAEPARRIATAGPPAEAATEPVPERRRRAQRRASVPSWDEIMFGATKDE